MNEHIEFLFIDESGDLGKLGTKYFTIVVLAIHEPKHLVRIIKQARERKLKKKLKELPELKANNSDDHVRKYILEKINACDCSISAVVIPKDKIREYLFDHKNKLYNYLCGILMEQISLNVDIVDITIDKRDNNKLLRDDFNNYIEGKIKGRRKEIKVCIKHLESHSSNELQAVDFVAWAVHRKFTYGDSQYYDIIKSRISNSGKEEIWK
ncbi:MAG: DUF3800 domain-containing protein [Candidatus Bilamarchaeaceae archaeon]